MTKHLPTYTIRPVLNLCLRKEARFLPKSIKMIDPNSSSENDQPHVTNLAQVDIETVHAESVRMHQSSAEVINAEDVELSQSASLEVNAGSVSTRQSALGFVQADVVTVQDGAVAAARAEKMSVNGNAGLVVAGSVEFGNAYVGIVAGHEVRGERIESVILLARNVEGNVTTVMDTRGALVAGLVGGLFAGIMLLLGRALFGRK